MPGHAASPLQQLSGLQEKQTVARRRGVLGEHCPVSFYRGDAVPGVSSCPAPAGSGTAEAGLSTGPSLLQSALTACAELAP